MSDRKELKGRKLLIASVGLATMSYVGCKLTDGSTTGNLLPPPDAAPSDLRAEASPPPLPPTGNLVPPPPTDAKDIGHDASDGRDGAGDAPLDSTPDRIPPVGNLLPPPPMDGGSDGAKDAWADAAKDA
jgi:hypothetical protein